MWSFIYCDVLRLAFDEITIYTCTEIAFLSLQIFLVLQFVL